MTIVGYIDNTNNLVLALFFQNQTSRKDFERYNYLVLYSENQKLHFVLYQI